ncbi:similar to Saccharomyces cerevisiae YBL025W RRN10 Protein involved in promoting high level transcription of rDNA, subunit of UAF (upstream activation factor) for RNA polymerase I [Maudiozyma barnettii]|uniref:Similar to Saccharomyces cerevisiae YBL025W RRN10 Protein involved in promoting high level transcription of rDNA, subunit of UAF (Upstream activation factor) for RNA polymerase I n=1 Tax=Maudiozyma barnettii TaxID=61262 RepID=A0A8H2ZHA4_9SACH|nr:Rrn10p [Kazachstania barnettii]CAB4255534.1 similar to Saccharomyces cerevisiae YBL025W RRN10 Protein involved in promoting high level transcription of rDNA, subunit of UAF (upstream activation factor) for RNA polymerase I [Kazachstania barnettii]CAD1784033.1 similar to Saccharomyces cerevisiae YBL025W RRN10 Protein involved in promoting high level transcription of rDNA, subunit of UAF (upstream activation factor) for RNA polymerase I [Kazachstania barnettii]
MDTSIYEACNDLVTEFHTQKVSPDEILATKVSHSVPIPFKTRDDLERDTRADREEGLFHGDVLPRIDLKVLHYFATQLCLQKYPHLINAMDETCMITLGLVVEQWIEEYLTSINDEVISNSEDTDDEVVLDQDSINGTSLDKYNDDPPKKRVRIGGGPSEVIANIMNGASSTSNI